LVRKRESTWLWHYYLPERYLARNAYLAVRTTRQVLANYPDATRVHPISRPQRRFNWPEALNHLTSANSATPYRDELFGTDSRPATSHCGPHLVTNAAGEVRSE